MKHLIEISKIVTKKKVKKIEIFDDQTLKNKNSKFNEFYEALMAMKFKNDRDAATFLYACSPTDDKYRQLKSRFRKRLLNTLFFLDVNLPSTSNYDRAYFSCNKDWTLVKILLSNNAEHTASDLAKGILTIALKYHFADIIVNCSRILRGYTSKHGEEKEFEQYDAYIKQYSNVLEAEIRSEELYQRVTMNYLLIQTPETTKELRDRIDIYCDALVSLSEQFESPIVMYNMYLVWAFRYEMLHDWDAMLEVCKRAEDYISNNPTFYQDEKMETFQLKKMSAFLHMRDYKNGKIEAEKSLQNLEDGSEAWFNFMEYYFLLAMHSDNFINALAIHNRAINHARYKKLPNMEREKWNLYETYLDYIIETQSGDNPAFLAHRKRTNKTSKFLNDNILYPKDQRIFTVHFVVAQIMYYLDKSNYSAVTERIDRLKNYANRQLKPEEYYRAINFIRLMQQLSKAEYQVEDLSNVDKYYNRLIDTPFYFRGLVQEMEVIPYEKLWNMMLKSVKK
jgi:hypothetical protein